jgi:xanthine dehydrogenase accessory factor
MLISADGSQPVGSIHPDVDQSLVVEAAGMLRDERSAIVERETPLGTLEVFIESFPPPQRLVIVGAVHVAVPLAQMGKMLGYHVTVVDPRDVFATRERFPDADDIVVEWPEDALPGLRLDRSTSVAVLTHDPKIDVPALALALNTEARYIGALGSRTTFAQRKADLAALGVAEEQMARIHAPIGLKIGARTPAEIALAVMSEIVTARRLGGPES